MILIENFVNTFLAPVALTVILALSLCSCTKSSSEISGNSVSDSAVLTESGLSDEFAFPGSDVNTSHADMQLPDNADSEQALAVSLSDYIGECTDLSLYSQSDVSDTDGCSIYYLIKPENVTDRTVDSELLLGAEKASVSIPCTYSSLLDNGFTLFGSSDKEVAISPDESLPLTLCTPESKELFGFTVSNKADTTADTDEIYVTGATITAVNNFSVFGGINGKSTISDIIKKMGNPDFIDITVNDTEFTATFRYDFKDISVICFTNGETKNLIALSIFES